MNGNTNICKKCEMEYYKNNPRHDKLLSEANKRYYKKIKTNLFEFLGNKCIVCNENDLDVLTLDHKFDDGKRDRKRFPFNNHYRYYLHHLIEAKKTLQILCSNCNLKKSLFQTEFKRLEKHNLVGF